MIFILQSVAICSNGKHDELMLMLLDEVSVVGSMVATFSRHDDGIASPFIVSTPC